MWRSCLFEYLFVSRYPLLNTGQIMFLKCCIGYFQIRNKHITIRHKVIK